MDAKFVLEAVVVLAAILMGTRAGGVGVGAVGRPGRSPSLVFIFHEKPGEPPIAAIVIILAVVTSASLMQAAGGIDWMVKVAAGIISSTRNRSRSSPRSPPSCSRSAPAPATSCTRCCPVIYDVSYRNKIRPSQAPVAAPWPSRAWPCVRPVSAAMAAMLTLTDGVAVQLRPCPGPLDHHPGVRGRHRGHVAHRGPHGDGAGR